MKIKNTAWAFQPLNQSFALVKVRAIEVKNVTEMTNFYFITQMLS